MHIYNNRLSINVIGIPHTYICISVVVVVSHAALCIEIEFDCCIVCGLFTFPWKKEMKKCRVSHKALNELHQQPSPSTAHACVCKSGSVYVTLLFVVVYRIIYALWIAIQLETDSNRERDGDRQIETGNETETGNRATTTTTTICDTALKMFKVKIHSESAQSINQTKIHSKYTYTHTHTHNELHELGKGFWS